MSAELAPQPAPAVPDVAAYCRRIGYQGDLAPTIATLRSLHQAHVGAIPFENIDVLLGRPILLDTASLERKLVTCRRGGYCFEQNLLFKDVLETLGFPQPGWPRACARVQPASARGRTWLLLVEAERRHFLVDVGFGGSGLLEPLPLSAGREFEFPLVSFRLTELGGLWVLHATQQGQWIDLYAFTLEPQERIDYEVANWFTSTYTSSVFRHSLTVQRVRREERVILRNRDLTIVRADGEEKRQVNSPAEARAILSEKFGLELPEGQNIPESVFHAT